MQRSRSNSMLGIAFGERSALVAEVASSEAGPSLSRAGEFIYPEGGLQDPAAVGKALAAFLKGQRFSARNAVLGLPAKWVLAKRKDVPAADPALVTETLRLQAEGEFPSELKDLTFDYAGEPSASEARSVLLVAAQKRYIDQVTQVASAAGLKPAAVAPFAAAIGAAGPPLARDAAVLLLGPGGAEFVSRHHGHPRVMRYLGAPTSAAPALGGELRRAAASAPLNGSTTNGQAAPGIIVWNDSGVDPSIVEKIGEIAGAPLRQGDLSMLGVSSSAEADDGRGYAAAVALALTGLRQTTTTVDLLHPKLVPPKQRGIDRRITIGAALAALVLLVVGWAGYDLYSLQSELDMGKADLTNSAPRVDMAKAVVAKVSYAQSWHGEKPKFLACLRDLTNEIPDDGKVYLTRFNMSSENMKGQMIGRAANDQVARALFDKLKTNPRFGDVALTFDPAEVGRTSNPESSFTMTFVYVPEK